MTPESIIRRPILLTEKASSQREQHQYAFEVHRKANKIQIRDAVQKLFKVSVTSVNTMVFRGKIRRMGRGEAKLQNWKKAIVTLKPGDSIDFFNEASGQGLDDDVHQDLQAHLSRAPTVLGARDLGPHQEGAREGAPRAADLEGRSQQPRPHHLALPRRRPQAALPAHRLAA